MTKKREDLAERNGLAKRNDLEERGGLAEQDNLVRRDGHAGPEDLAKHDDLARRNELAAANKVLEPRWLNKSVVSLQRTAVNRAAGILRPIPVRNSPEIRRAAYNQTPTAELKLQAIRMDSSKPLLHRLPP